MHKIVKDLVSLIENNDLEELGYFQFGGSDFVMVFERASNVRLINQPGVNVQQRSWIGNAFPYSMA